jgi:gliding motility-associated-like protein
MYRAEEGNKLYTGVVHIVSVLLFLLVSSFALAQPSNDDCANAKTIIIPGGGFALGAFVSTTDDISSATVQPTESFAPAILVSGLNKKSMWYKFKLPTHRSVRVTLQQPGIAIAAGNAGFAVYKTDSCLPINNQLSSKLTPIATFGNTYHPCVEPGDYLVQVTTNNLANGPLSIKLQVSDSAGAQYDHPASAQVFGTLSQPVTGVSFFVNCQSIEDESEKCTGLNNGSLYTKTTWHTFKTPAYLDYLSVLLASPTGGFTGNYNSIGYKLYEGDVKADGMGALLLRDGCDSLKTQGYTPAHKMYKCGDLKPNTTYTIQLFYHQNFTNDVRLAIAIGGIAPTNAPEPIASAMGTTNTLGILPSNASGITTNVFDYLACNSRMVTHPCAPTLPATGVMFSNINYTLSTFFTFKLSSSSNITIDGRNAQCGPNVLLRLFRQDVSNDCSSVDTTNIIRQGLYSISMDCLPAGMYTLQVLGRDTAVPITSFYYGHLLGGSPLCMLNNLGQKINVSIRVASVKTINKYALNSVGAYDTINVSAGIMQPLVNNILYNAKIDTFGCENTVRPAGALCSPTSTKAMYRQFSVADSGIITFTNLTYPLLNKLYKGDANALASAQNAHAFPDSITGLKPVTLCLDYSTGCAGDKICLVPGTYTFATFGTDANVGTTDKPSMRFNTGVNTVHHNYATAQNLGSILDTVAIYNSTQVTSDMDYFSCRDNAEPINGYQPCSISGKPATKAIYRQFYLSEAAIVAISNAPIYCTGGYMTLFNGKASDGLARLTPVGSPWNCFTSAQVSNACNPLPAGWYTVVSYGSGPTYENPMQNVNQNGYGSYVAMGNQFIIRVTKACPGPKYNRPFKAAIDTVTKQPFLIQWAPRASHTAAYPKTDTTYKLYTEYFNCTVDTPFTNHPIAACATGYNRVVYYVFRLTQESYINIDTKSYWGQVFADDVRIDSLLNLTATAIQPCLKSDGYIQLCRMQPGVYTLVLFANDANSCSSVQPTIYIDQVGTSRFDHANKAYDFGTVPADSTFYNGKPGDVNPLNALRAPSNDFFYCTTGAQQTDPAESACYTKYNPAIYNHGVNNTLYSPTNLPTSPYIARRNLWYTFVVDKPGYVHVKVTNKTTGKQYQYPFAVYRSNVDGTLPFASIVSTGELDSTNAQGLSLVEYTTRNTYYCGGTDRLSFYRDPCTQRTPERYYIVVDNRNPTGYADIHAMNPNSQVEVSIMVDSVDLVPTKFDHYSQASNFGTIGVGTHKGVTDNYSCATRDVPDPVYAYTSCNKTLWYKFTTNVTGLVRYRILVNGTSYYSYDNIQLFKQIIPGDSTTNGLSYIGGGTVYDNTVNAYWTQNCVSPGTYYILLPGCNRLNENVYPEIKIIEQEGDFCSAPVVSSLNGPGAAISSVTVDCHTIGTDYGEFNPTLTCPANAVKTAYKSSWFRIDITGNDTLDVTAFLVENTTVNPADIQYRLMTGDCNAMQEQSCVQDAQTQNTYKCLAPGSYYLQVFTPATRNKANVTGTINLNLSAVVHADTCAPVNNCLANANFVPQFNCNTSDSISLINYSTYGSSIEYNWDFGYNGQRSTEVSPKFVYPSLSTSHVYTIQLTVKNTRCGLENTFSAPITIPARPAVNLGNDTSLCTGGSSLLLNATSYPGATYLWQNGSTSATFNANTPGVRNYYVKVTYNGCAKMDTIKVNISPLTAKATQAKMICGIDSVQLNGYRGYGETYRWNNGASGSSIYAKAPGIYWVDILLNGCTVRDSFNVTSSAFPFGADTSLCLKQPFILNATVPNASGYLWQNNSTATTFPVSSPGEYWVRITYPSGCVIRDTIKVSSITSRTSNIIATICPGQPYAMPSGAIVTMAGIYKDTLRTAGGCDSMIITVDLASYPLSRVSSTASICDGTAYALPSGAVVYSAGIYNDTLRYTTGCDSVIHTIEITVKPTTKQVTAMHICAGSSYTLPWGQVVNAAGTYSDTLHYTAGCDSVINTIVVAVKPVNRQSSVVRLCSGQSYILPSGAVTNAAGVYSDTLRYTSGCDSVIYTLDVQYARTLRTHTSASICADEHYTLPSGAVVTLPGMYMDTIRYTTGCDSLVTTIDLSVKAVTRSSSNVSICQGTSYTLPSGAVIDTPGNYTDTLRYVTGCDSVITSINLVVNTVIRTSASAVICQGEYYTLPSGLVVNTAGIYQDTLRYSTGCDSVIITSNLTIKGLSRTNVIASVCGGQSYTLPAGSIVSIAGVYTDTLRYTSGCDSVITTTILSIGTVAKESITSTICEGEMYTLPSGQIVHTAGVYVDTLRRLSGCDSVITTTTLSLRTVQRVSTRVTLCAGETFTLPTGIVISAAGTYTDTLRYTAGCDSISTTTNISIRRVSMLAVNATICNGESYTLPSGQVVSIAGSYSDTLQYTSGCDSLIINTTLVTRPVTRTNRSASICAGQSYTLPSGTVVSSAGVYIDTLKHAAGCDSIIITTTLAAMPVIKKTVQVVLCHGETYTLPAGVVVSAPGLYIDTVSYVGGCDSLITITTISVKNLERKTEQVTLCERQSYTTLSGAIIRSNGVYTDTLRYTTGCDSVITTITLHVNAITRRSSNVSVCAGETYTLPSGLQVNASGTYVDTLKYTSGCDSVITTTTLSVGSIFRTAITTRLCSGQTYTLPSGMVVHTAGVYTDTLKHLAGCDSAIITTTVITKPVSRVVQNVTLCSGQTYTLPGGTRVSSSGTYMDTLRYQAGCDSVIATTNLIIRNLQRLTQRASICAGGTFTLPAGNIVGTPGTYTDTLRYSNGCDSIIYTTIVDVESVQRISRNATICFGGTYTRPGGTTTTTAGLYTDTLRYAAGCDSVIITTNLAVKSLMVRDASAVICSGQFYRLPSGTIVSNAGVYVDTLRHTTGCDSVITTTSLQVRTAVINTVKASICAGETYRLPTGALVGTAGTYTLLIKNNAGCDSIINQVELKVNAVPRISISKSNDVDCMIGSAKLEATGGRIYQWTPAYSTNNASIPNPTVTPVSSTTYQVKVTGFNGCTATDSIQVKVISGNVENGFLLPSAFTPNNDGKNDCFGVKSWGAITDLNLMVFDRWGNVLFNTTDPAKCWDGTYKGYGMGTGAYVYQVTATTHCGPVFRKGTVILIR